MSNRADIYRCYQREAAAKILVSVNCYSTTLLLLDDSCDKGLLPTAMKTSIRMQAMHHAACCAPFPKTFTSLFFNQIQHQNRTLFPYYSYYMKSLGSVLVCSVCVVVVVVLYLCVYVCTCMYVCVSTWSSVVRGLL